LLFGVAGLAVALVVAGSSFSQLTGRPRNLSSLNSQSVRFYDIDDVPFTFTQSVIQCTIPPRKALNFSVMNLLRTTVNLMAS
jgi:hypothetical protein